MRTLDFSNKQMAEARPGVFNGFTAIHELFLNDTSIELTSMTGLDNLFALTWQHSGITVVNKEILNHFPKLNYLKLSYNQISSIEQDAWINMRDLEIINLSDNELIIVKAEMFNNLPVLDTLRLDDNKIAQIEPNA